MPSDLTEDVNPPTVVRRGDRAVWRQRPELALPRAPASRTIEGFACRARAERSEVVGAEDYSLAGFHHLMPETLSLARGVDCDRFHITDAARFGVDDHGSGHHRRMGNHVAAEGRDHDVQAAEGVVVVAVCELTIESTVEELTQVAALQSTQLPGVPYLYGHPRS